MRRAVGIRKFSRRICSSGLAWGPGKRSATEKVKVEVRNRFSSIGSVVDDESVSCFFELALPGDTLRGGEKMGKDRVVFGGDGTVASVMFFGDEKDVGRGLGCDIAEGKVVIVFVEDVGLSLPVDDLFEDRFGHGGYQMVSSRREGLRVRARARMKWTISSLRRWQEARHDADPVRARTHERRPSRRRAEAREETFSSTREESCWKNRISRGACWARVARLMEGAKDTSSKWRAMAGQPIPVRERRRMSSRVSRSIFGRWKSCRR